MNAAMKRWGKLWDVLGFQNVHPSNMIEVLFSPKGAYPAPRYCFGARRVNGVVGYWVAVAPTPKRDDRNFITPHEADILSDLLLGTNLANDKTNYT